MLQVILKEESRSGVMGLILVPTRELCSQIEKVLKHLLDFCGKDITLFAVSGTRSVSVEKPRMKEKPTILVRTPARICENIRVGNLTLVDLKILCIDEADLILSFGYEDDMKFLTQNLPQRAHQCLLMSATLSEDILKLKQLIMHEPIVIK